MNAQGIPPGHFGLDPHAPMSISYLDSVGAKIALAGVREARPPAVNPVREGMPLVAPRVLYLGAGIATGTRPEWPTNYDWQMVGGVPKSTTTTSPNPAYAEQERLTAVMEAVAARAQAAIPDLWVAVGRQITQTDAVGVTIAGRQFDHIICPPTVERGGRYIGPRFLCVWAGSPCINDPDDRLAGARDGDDALAIEGIARVLERKGYFAGYAARVWGPEPTLHDDLPATITGSAEALSSVPDSVKAIQMESMVGARRGFVQGEGFMGRSTGLMAAAGIDATYNGGSASADEEIIAALVSDYFGVAI